MQAKKVTQGKVLQLKKTGGSVAIKSAKITQKSCDKKIQSPQTLTSKAPNNTINNLLKEDLQKKAMNGLNDRIRNLKKVTPSEPSVDVLRKFREDSRFNRLTTNSTQNDRK